MTEKAKPRPPTIEELEAQGRAPWKAALSPDSQTAYPGPQVLYGSVKGFFETWVYFPDPRMYDVATAWTLHTWHYRKFRSSPPVCPVGPINSGKTTLLECLEEIAYRAIRGGSMSNSTLFRLNDSYGPTFLIDESQVYNQEEWTETQAFLNERYRKGGRVWRVEGGEGGVWIPRSFDAYGPTVLAGSMGSWEAMISRAIVLNMEKGKAPEKTLTELFYDEGAKLRVWLKHYSETFEPNVPHEGDTPLYDPVMEKLIQEGKIDRAEPDLFPPADVSMFEDGRVQEKVEPLLACAPIGSPRDSILSFARDMARKQQANEDTSYLVEYLQAYLASTPSQGKVSLKDVRWQLARMRGITKTRRATENGEHISYEEPDVNAKGMPSAKFVGSCLDTLGFERTRMPGGDSGVLANSGLEERLRRRYRLGNDSLDSLHSLQSGDSPSGSERSEQSESFLEGYGGRVE